MRTATPRRGPLPAGRGGRCVQRPLFPRQLLTACPFAGRKAEAPRRRGFQSENPSVPQVPGASVEVVPGKGGSHENALAETEIPVSGCRSLIAETGGERLGVWRISLLGTPGSRVRVERGRTGGSPLLRRPSSLALVAQRSDVLQQEINLAGVRGRFGAFALGDDEAFVHPDQADGGFARTFYLDGEDFGLAQTEYRLALIGGGCFPLKERASRRAIAAKCGREFPPPAAAMPA